MSYFKRTFFFPQLHSRLSKAPSTPLSFYAVVASLSPSRRQSLHIVQDSGTFNMSLLNNSNHNLTLDCPIYTEDSKYWMEFINFWVGGVLQTLSIIFGFLGKKLHPNRFLPPRLYLNTLLVTGNLVFIFILTRKELRNSFNLLLVALALFDLCFLIGAQLESIR